VLRKAVPLVLGLCALWSNGVAAQDYPNHPIQMIVAFPAGGNTDLTARALAPELGKALGQPVVVVNKGGAGGVIGSTELSRARADGYTIAMSPVSPLTIMPHLQKVEYGLDSFRYVCLTYDNSLVLMAGKDAPFKTFTEFAAFAKAKPDNVAYATGGPGSMPHLLLLDVLRRIGTTGVHIPFAGAGPMAQAILGGTVSVMAESPAIATANDLPILAVFAAKRLPSLPNVPTMKELGYDINAFSAGGLIVPANTPDAVVTKLEGACAKSVESDGFQATMKQIKATSRYLPPKGFRDLAIEDSANMRAMIQGAGLLAK
jgi:tripartite-type tricarboxylate transporter receptor subunit TctC